VARRDAGSGSHPHHQWRSSTAVEDSYDNALAETINGLFKAGVIHRRGPWRSFDAVDYAKFDWVDWFNNRRLLEPIGNIPPVEAEANSLRFKGCDSDFRGLSSGFHAFALTFSPIRDFPNWNLAPLHGRRPSKRKCFTEEQVTGVLKKSEAGAETCDICRRHGIKSATFFSWRKRWCGINASKAKRVGELEAENAKLKRIMADGCKSQFKEWPPDKLHHLDGHDLLTCVNLGKDLGSTPHKRTDEHARCGQRLSNRLNSVRGAQETWRPTILGGRAFVG